jgi:hypothetical protein
MIIKISNVQATDYWTTGKLPFFEKSINNHFKEIGKVVGRRVIGTGKNKRLQFDIEISDIVGAYNKINDPIFSLWEFSVNIMKLEDMIVKEEKMRRIATLEEELKKLKEEI